MALTLKSQGTFSLASPPSHTLDLIESKKCCASKDTIRKVEIQPTEREKICANHTSDKGPVSSPFTTQ